MTLLAASRIKPSDEINSVNTKSAPCSLHRARNGGSLTSSMGARSRGKSGNCMSPIFGKTLKQLGCKNREYDLILALLRVKTIPLGFFYLPLVVCQSKITKIVNKSKTYILGFRNSYIRIILIQIAGG